MLRGINLSPFPILSPDFVTGRAILCQRPGGVDVLQLVADYRVPMPKRGEVLVKIASTGINRCECGAVPVWAESLVLQWFRCCSRSEIRRVHVSYCRRSKSQRRGALQGVGVPLRTGPHRRRRRTAPPRQSRPAGASDHSMAVHSPCRCWALMVPAWLSRQGKAARCVRLLESSEASPVERLLVIKYM